jgi:hypothetical protein
MEKKSFFYNYDAVKVNGYSKFNYGIIDVESDDDCFLAGVVLDKIKSNAKELYPDADSINIIAFNRV